MYAYEDRIRAVELYIKLGKRDSCRSIFTAWSSVNAYS